MTKHQYKDAGCHFEGRDFTEKKLNQITFLFFQSVGLIAEKDLREMLNDRGVSDADLATLTSLLIELVDKLDPDLSKLDTDQLVAFDP